MKVKANVYVVTDGQTVLLRPGDTVPDGVEVTNPDALEDEATSEEAPAPAKRAPAKKAAPASE